MSTEHAGGDNGAHSQAVENCQWLWEAVRKLNVDLVTSQLIPVDWDWNQIHPVYGTPLMALVGEGIRLGKSGEKNPPVWRLLRRCLATGADPRVEAKQVSGSQWYGGSAKYLRIEIQRRGHSAITLVFALMEAFEKHANAYTQQIANCEKMLKLFAGFVPENKGNKVSVPEAIVHMWEAVLVDKQSGDVRLVVVGEREGDAITNADATNCGGALKAHRAVLRRASCVLDALLGSRHGGAQDWRHSRGRGEHGGCHADAPEIYTGTICYEPKASIMLGVMDLAHCWQVAHVVDMAERGLLKLVNIDNLVEICEAAVLKGLSALRAACKQFAADEENLAKLTAQRESLPPAVMKELRLRPNGGSSSAASSL